jgi:hypothetical protein
VARHRQSCGNPPWCAGRARGKMRPWPAPSRSRASSSSPRR